MNRNRALSIVSVGLVSFFLMALSAPALLAHDEWSQRPNAYQQGEQVGYNYGYEHGRLDRDAGAGYNFDGREYRRALTGYDLRFGSLRQYRAGFRAGYEAGYKNGYDERRGGHWREGRDWKDGRDRKDGRDWRHRERFQ